MLAARYSHISVGSYSQIYVLDKTKHCEQYSITRNSWRLFKNAPDLVDSMSAVILNHSDLYAFGCDSQLVSTIY